MSDKSQNIHDMIQTFQLAGHPESMASRILDILDLMNRRMNEIEGAHPSDQSTREIWHQFHKVWGLAHDHDYQKQEWVKLQNMLHLRIGHYC